MTLEQALLAHATNRPGLLDLVQCDANGQWSFGARVTAPTLLDLLKDTLGSSR